MQRLSLPLLQSQIKIRSCERAELPAFLGSTLRGAFGRALKSVVCIVNHGECQRCIVKTRCIYPYIFETPVPENIIQLQGQARAPHPFVLSLPIEPDYNWNSKRQIYHQGDVLYFRLLLMGKAVYSLPFVIYTIQKMARQGLGVHRGKFELAHVVDREGREIFSAETGTLSSNLKPVPLSELVEKRLENLHLAEDSLKVRFISPVRIRSNGDLQTHIDFQLLMRNILRRLSQLMILHGQEALELDFKDLLEQASKVATLSSSLRWIDLERYSSRQKTKLKIGGLVGTVRYRGNLAKFLPLLAAGEILNIGASTSFGLGEFRIEV
ncbi:MAG: CRISPR system precrRNA processing endoribonuclease RAMP protein Cas6 [Acidobacteriota bacterium]|nr:CRISPR system precrRNA processing endoribonuclease RAMP protein Cas6 [Blastocatellia bacterium]MDW8412370.1 CRISPR system precrRNA processing endoribonuclease RAMP protein Cas6 [Acidobacteriota bacterium]